MRQRVRRRHLPRGARAAGAPDHSTFSKLRHGKFRESDLFCRLFEDVVAKCIAEGLVGGTGFAVDASLISADVQKQNSSKAEVWNAEAIDPPEAPRAVREYLDTDNPGIVFPPNGSVRQADVGSARTMLDRTERRFGLRPDWLAATQPVVRKRASSG